MDLHTNSENVVKIAQGMHCCEAFIFQHCAKFPIFGVPTPHTLTPALIGKIWRSGVDRRSTSSQISPNRSNVSPLRGKKPKISQVIQIPAYALRASCRCIP